MSALGLRYHYHDVCRVMELLTISIADSNQILIFLDRWETGSETDTLYLKSHGSARLTHYRHYPLLITFILSMVTCLSRRHSLSLNKYCNSLGLFVYFQYRAALECFSSSYWNTNTTICYSPGSTQPSNEIVLQMILSKGKDFYWMKIKYFYIALYVEHRREFYHHFLDFFSLSLLICRFVRSLWAELSEKKLKKD